MYLRQEHLSMWSVLCIREVKIHIFLPDRALENDVKFHVRTCIFWKLALPHSRGVNCVLLLFFKYDMIKTLEILVFCFHIFVVSSATVLHDLFTFHCRSISAGHLFSISCRHSV